MVAVNLGKKNFIQLFNLTNQTQNHTLYSHNSTTQLSKLIVNPSVPNSAKNNKRQRQRWISKPVHKSSHIDDQPLQFGQRYRAETACKFHDNGRKS